MIYGVKITTPDGVERIMRSTQGALGRILKLCGEMQPDLSAPVEHQILRWIEKHVVEYAFCLIEHVDGKPPEGLTVAWMLENYPVNDRDLLAAVLECLSNGSKKKEDLLKEIQDRDDILTKVLTGRNSGPSLASPLESTVPPRRRQSSKASSGTSIRMSSKP